MYGIAERFSILLSARDVELSFTRLFTDLYELITVIIANFANIRDTYVSVKVGLNPTFQRHR